MINAILSAVDSLGYIICETLVAGACIWVAIEVIQGSGKQHYPPPTELPPGAEV